ncbi:Phosphoglucomutase [Acholeplasma oculi]|uniref:Phosphoglucomutase n=1 Tax=Acholeplasma oculi TaxID=35623 RepID=A0A061AB04_9MOLU|nr:phospho-sugar mutase [Acholeplasma oculi]CDR31028.1 Phosphoglucomutase [Acholeplasma oculi]SKC36487.1 phosphoglucomutase [Acholeplasma oculi]SUT90533.1 Phosphoglucomutase [Acholeplasma oculi]
MSYQDNYQKWLNEKSLTNEEVHILKSMTETEKEESFYQDLTFGTGGIRGILGLGSNRINAYTIRKATKGLANYLIKNQLLNGVAISYDNRFGSIEFAYEAAKVLAYNGIKSYVFKTLRPTPMLSFAVRHFNTSAGIMLTASHNPKEYNGYKVYNSTGAQLNTYESLEVIKEIDAIKSPFGIETANNELINWIDASFDEIYLKKVRELTIHHDEKILKLVYSPLHGTGGQVIPKLLKEQGYEVHEVLEQMIVDPAFTHTLSSNPEEAIAYERSIEQLEKVNADIILVTDPDADRLGVALKHQNKIKILTGNQTAAIILNYLIQEKKPTKGIVYTTVVTSNLIKDIAMNNHLEVGETLTGFKFIGEQAKLNEGIKPYIFGCEESYGSLISDFVRDKDAVQAVYMLSEIANHLKHKGLTLMDYLEDIYQQYGYYVDQTISLSLKGIEGLKRIDDIMTYFRTNGLDLPIFNVKKQLDFINGLVNGSILLPPSNVLRFESEDGFICLRPSGTEPKLKLYYSTKKPNQKDALAYIEQLILEMNSIISKI